MADHRPIADDLPICIRVVIADDVDGIRQLWRLILEEDDDIDVVGLACDGREALELTGRTRPDVLVLDLSMPDLTGIEVLNALRVRQPEVAVVVASGFSESRLAGTVLERGAFAYFEKGNPPVELREIVIRAATVTRAGHDLGSRPPGASSPAVN